nr:biotin carboxylase N-terminal domain-containing protein [Micromonospora sp. DSM 115978]
MIHRMLVANRGEIARRVIATCRARGIETVAVHSDPDADAPHVAEADLAVRLPGAAPSATYLRADLLVEAARRAGADAVHPGYGFLAENAEFAAAVVAAGLVWVGPPAEAIAVMGSKIEAKALLSRVGVPMLPTYTDAGQVSAFPVLVKASAGGGGRGMRVVRSAGELPGAIDAARQEATAAFGDGTIFIERYVERARHVEVQVVADTYGSVLALGERECSIQRRHQKVIEETPSVAVDVDLRTALGAAAVAATRAVGYVGAGTVEFLLTGDGEFFFLEMNTRLQVEHPVTECVTGLDLVGLQLLVAEGGALPAAAPPPAGHAIEVRLCAEDPAADWRPATGTLHRFRVPGVAVEFGPPAGSPGRAGLRLDSGVRDGSVVGSHYDSMLAKLVAWAPTRPEAVRLLAGALARAEIHGVVTNRDLLLRVLRHPEFGAGDIDTGFLDRHPDLRTPLLGSLSDIRLSCLAAALAGAAGRRAAAPVLAGLPSGWRNVPAGPQTIGYDSPAGPVTVDYRLDRSGGLAHWSVRPTESEVPAVVLLAAMADRVLLDVDGLRVAFAVHRVGEAVHVDGPSGSVSLTELPRFPAPVPELAEGALVAPLPGTVSRVLVTAGQPVAAGELLLTLEAMKLEHPVHAPTAGLVTELPVAAGSQVDTGAVLAVVTPE